MTMPALRCLSALWLCAALSSAQAATFFALPAATGAFSSPNSLFASFFASAGAGEVSFQLQGYNTLDGDSFFIDILDVSLNGSSVFSATYDLGGGGIDRVLGGSAGVALKDGLAKTVDLQIPVTLLGGVNALVISYSSPDIFDGTPRWGEQGLADEGWGLNSASVSSAAPVPEAPAAAMFAAGLLAGLLALRRRR
jgi:MYXO-CTERM domain-containing protein